MDASLIWTVATGIAGGASGFFGNRAFGGSSSVETAANVVELMKTEVDILKERLDNKDAEVQRLTTELGVVKELVTQRADVEAVHDTVKEVKETVDRIADKVGA